MPGGLEARRSTPPAAPAPEGISVAACTALVERLVSADDWAFLAGWLESVLAGRPRADPALAVRLLRAYRETGRLEPARELASSLPSAPVAWTPLDTARLAIERAALATLDGREDRAEAELRVASRALATVPKAPGVREQLDIHLVQAHLDLSLGRTAPATQALRLAEHVFERIEDGAWRASVGMTLGELAMRLADPRSSSKHYASALASSPARGAAAMSAHGSLALALGCIGRYDEARQHARQSAEIAGDAGVAWRHADAQDILATVEIWAERPQAAMLALEEAFAALGDSEHPALRYHLAEHRAWALAMLGRVSNAEQWLLRAEKAHADLAPPDRVDEANLVAVRARVLEVSGQPEAVIHRTLPLALAPSDGFVSNSIHLILGRCYLALGDEASACAAVERAALSGEKYGWVYPEPRASRRLWELASKSGDSRVVRYAERMAARAEASNAGDPAPTLSPVSSSALAVPASSGRLEPVPDSADGEALTYVTTPQGVTRVPRSELAKATDGAAVVVDTLSHHLRIEDREVSLERRRALEPLVVQLLRRAREGLTAEEILRAAGGPGPESADAEHRVRVLISRVRDLLGSAAAIERVRDAGEYGRTRYRLSPQVRFALIEPLFGAGGP